MVFFKVKDAIWLYHSKLSKLFDILIHRYWFEDVKTQIPLIKFVMLVNFLVHLERGNVDLCKSHHQNDLYASLWDMDIFLISNWSGRAKSFLGGVTIGSWSWFFFWAGEKRAPELALSYSHSVQYLAYHYRTLIWRWMEIETETHIGALDWAPKVLMRSRRRQDMSKEVRTARGASTHCDGGTDIMETHQGQLDWDWWSMWSNWTLWMWLTRRADWEARTMALGFDSTACTGFLGT